MKQLLVLLFSATALFAQVPAAYPGSYQVQNDTSTGTTFQKLAKLSAGKAILSGTADTSSIGICVQNCGTTGSAIIAFSGITGCVVDGTTTLDHWVVLSTTVTGDCHDTGATTYPTTGVVVGQVVQVSTGAASVSQINLTANTMAQASSGGGGGGAAFTSAAWASRPTCTGTNEGQGFMPTDGAGLKSICISSTWKDYYKDYPVIRPPAASSFTTVNGGTLTDTNGSLKFTKSSDLLGINLIPLASSSNDWDVRIAFASYTAGSGVYPECGIVWSTGTVAGTSQALGTFIANAVEGTNGLQRNLLSRIYAPINGSVAAANPSVSPLHSWMSSDVFRIRVTRSGTTFNVYVGDGDDWEYQGTNSDSSTYTHVGFGCNPRGTALTTMRVFEFTGYSN